MNVTNWYCNWWIVPPIFLVGPTFADEANSQLRLGVDWCAHHQDSEHASQTEDCSWNFELNLFPRIDEPRCPFFLGGTTLIDCGVGVFLFFLLVFCFERNIYRQVEFVSFFFGGATSAGRFGLQQDPTTADWLSLLACELWVRLEFRYSCCRRSSHRGADNHRSALGSTGFRCLMKWVVGPILKQYRRLGRDLIGDWWVL